MFLNTVFEVYGQKLSFLIFSSQMFFTLYKIMTRTFLNDSVEGNVYYYGPLRILNWP